MPRPMHFVKWLERCLSELMTMESGNITPFHKMTLDVFNANGDRIRTHTHATWAICIMTISTELEAERIVNQVDHVKMRAHNSDSPDNDCAYGKFIYSPLSIET